MAASGSDHAQGANPPRLAPLAGSTDRPDAAIRARNAVLRQYAMAHDAWSEEEQLRVAKGEDIEAAGAHGFALMVLKAYIAELNNPAVP